MYPQWLESWWVERACRVLGAADLADASVRLEKEIRRLSDLFTTGRATAFGDYGRDGGLLLAYGLFFFPQTFARVRYPVAEAIQPHGWQPPDGRPIRLLDLGAGLGGATLGAADALARAFPDHRIEALAVDQSGGSLATLQDLAKDKARWLPGISVETERGDLRSWFAKGNDGRRWDWIMASFSVGEAFFGQPAEAMVPWMRAALARLEENGLLLVMEPALQETAERLAGLRDLLAKEAGYFIWAPCLHHHPCPLLAEGTHWCHEVKRRTPPESLEFLNRHLHRSIHDLKYSFLLLGQSSPPRPWARAAGIARLVTPLQARKGRFFWSGCAADGCRRDFEVQKREADSSTAALLKKTERGDILETRRGRPVGPRGIFRLEGVESFKIHPIHPLSKSSHTE